MAGLSDLIPGRERPREPEPIAIPARVDERLRRGRTEMLKDAPKRRLCQRFERGDTYWYINRRGVLGSLQTSLSPVDGKQPHRIRNTFNFIRPIIEDKVSAATQRIPGYDVTATTTDLPDAGAAKLASNVARYGYDQWRLREVTVDACTYAIGHGGDAFAFPYFDASVGPFVQVGIDEFGEPEYQGIGEVKVIVLGGNEAYWEAGVKFLDSRWYAFERAQPCETVMAYPGYLGGALNPDAGTSDIPTDSEARDHMVLVTNYLERPSQKNPKGRWLVFANGRQILPEEDYPLKDTDGTVLDEPCLHRLRYRHDPQNDRDLGLTWQLIDPQRTFQDAYNKAVEWKNRVLVPQILAPRGSIKTARTDEPGLVIEYDPIGGVAPQWENVQQIPESLFRIANEMKNLMREISAYEDIHADPNLAAKTVQEVIQQSQARWQSFLGDLAEWHSRLMRHCLCLVANHYTEPRTLAIQGEFGPDFIPDFRGAKLMGQVNVTVNPGTMQYRSRQEIQNRIGWIAQTFPGYLMPEQAIKALDTGDDSILNQGYALDVGRVWAVIRRIKDGTVMDMPTRDQTDALGNPFMVPQTDELGQPIVDPMTSEPKMQIAIDPETGQPPQVPGWMPDLMDNEQVWLRIFADWMKTTDFELLDPSMQAVARNIYTGILSMRNEKAAQQQQLESQMAQQAGMSNAAKTPEPKALPSLPGLNG